MSVIINTVCFGFFFIFPLSVVIIYNTYIITLEIVFYQNVRYYFDVM